MLDITMMLDGTPPTNGVAVTSTRVSSNVIDIGSASDVGAGEPLGVHVLVVQTFVGAGASLQVSLESCATIGGSYVPLILSPVILVGNLVAGKDGSEIFRYAIPPNEANNAAGGVLATPGEFLRLRYTVAGGPFTAGAVMAWVSPRQDRNVFRAYPANYTVLVPAGEL